MITGAGHWEDDWLLYPIISLFCTFLMLMEARRYRFFDIWRSRARMIEINFYRPMPEWAEILAQDMEWPHFHMSWWEAVGRRLRRNYQWIYVILLGSWGETSAIRQVTAPLVFSSIHARLCLGYPAQAGVDRTG